jgi:hypothetical protein
VHQPADAGGHLLRIQLGQHHTVVQRTQNALLGDSVPALHQVGVQDADLPCRSAEANSPQAATSRQRIFAIAAHSHAPQMKATDQTDSA